MCASEKSIYMWDILLSSLNFILDIGTVDHHAIRTHQSPRQHRNMNARRHTISQEHHPIMIKRNEQQRSHTPSQLNYTPLIHCDIYAVYIYIWIRINTLVGNRLWTNSWINSLFLLHGFHPWTTVWMYS